MILSSEFYKKEVMKLDIIRRLALINNNQKMKNIILSFTLLLPILLFSQRYEGQKKY